MAALFPIYTLENECQDCYKCVRHCSCKAIKIVNARATVIPELCVSCGACVRVCPAGAKQIRSDLARLKQMLDSGERVYASIAPSFGGYFKNVTIHQLAAALKKIGFAGVSETAHGAQQVSAATAEFLKTAPDGVYLSSACPAAVQYIQRYLPEWAPAITPFDSPLLTHAKMLRRQFGNEIKVAFFGPCAAKKNEADTHADTLNLALTFAMLEKLFEEHEIKPQTLEGIPLDSGDAEEGRLYPYEGGMNETLRTDGSAVRFVQVSGLEAIGELLSVPRQATPGVKIFVEMLSCKGGCVNGPVMTSAANSIDVISRISQAGGTGTSVGRPVTVDLAQAYPEAPAKPCAYSEEEIRGALASVGKFQPQDELNCGGCGYNSCREFACALLAGKAETAMCHNFLRQNFQRTSHALIKYISAGVVIVDDKLDILESNRHFAELLGEGISTIYDNLGSLASLNVKDYLPFTDLFESVLEHGGEIEKFNQPLNGRIVNISIFSIAVGKTAGAVIQDVTKTEFQREQIAQKARELIRKNVHTVQEVARLFGEHMAESEMLLEDIAGVYCAKNSDTEPSA